MLFMHYEEKKNKKTKKQNVHRNIALYSEQILEERRK